MPVISLSEPYYPNYRLGPIDGSGCDTLGLNNEPLADFWWFADSTLTVEFADNSSYEPAEWHWTFGDGGMSADTNPVHTFPASGIYTVCLCVSNQYAADTVCKQLQVGGATGAWAPGQAQAALRVVPNPASDRILVQLPGPDGGRLEIFDILGNLMKTVAAPGRNLTLEIGVGDLPGGYYFCRLTDRSQTTVTAKFAIQR